MSAFPLVRVDEPEEFQLPKRRVNKQVVTARQVTRYFIYGRGYNSNLVAHMQIAKRYVVNLEYKAWIASGPTQKQNYDFSKQWYSERYPVRVGCPCHFCSYRQQPKSGIPAGRFLDGREHNGFPEALHV